MNRRTYQKLVATKTPKENTLPNILIAFFIGGCIGLIGTFLFTLFQKSYSDELAISYTLLILIAFTSFLTGIGIADTIFTKFKCGLIIPITGFAHSVSSAIIDYKKEGFLNMGANAFKLAGSVLLYGVVSAIILTLIKVVLHV